MNIGESPESTRHRIEDSAEDMYRYLVANTPEPDEAKIRLYCDQSVSHFDWLVAHGVPFEDSYHREKKFKSNEPLMI